MGRLLYSNSEQCRVLTWEYHVCEHKGVWRLHLARATALETKQPAFSHTTISPLLLDLSIQSAIVFLAFSAPRLIGFTGHLAKIRIVRT